jgi:MYXO-CTERM domain-containing protein
VLGAGVRNHTRDRGAADAHARDMAVDCTYSGSYNTPYNWFGVCAAEIAAPAGCPLYFLSATNAAPGSITARVTRGASVITLPSTTTLVDSVDESIATVDVYSCNCDHVNATVPFHRYSMIVPGAQLGDVVGFDLGPGAQGDAQNFTVYIDTAGPCPAAPDWPTTFAQATACDKCPTDQGDGFLPPPDAGSNSTAPHPGGCSAAGEPAAAFALLGLFALRRRRVTR